MKMSLLNNTKTVDLKPDRSLLDPQFDGYKLYLQTLPIRSLKLDQGVDSVKLQDDQYSYQHVKAFGLHNGLFPDLWNEHVVYFIDSVWRVMRFQANLDHGGLEVAQPVFSIPNKDNQRLVPGRCHVTLSFPSNHRAVLADGTGKLYIVNTGDRNQSTQQWQVEFTCEPGSNEPDEACPSIILDSVIYVHRLDRPDRGDSHVDSATNRPGEGDNDESLYCDCVLMSVEAKRDTLKLAQKTEFTTVLTWINLLSDDKSHWRIRRRRQLLTNSVPDLVTLKSRGQGIYIASERVLRLVYDSDKPEMEAPNENENSNEKEKSSETQEEGDQEILYNWSQTDDDVTAVFVLPDNVTSSDVTYVVTSSSIELGVCDQGRLLHGQLYASVDVHESTWTLADGKLELSLVKQRAGLWPEVVVGDRSGQLVLDSDQQAKLDHITSSLRLDPSLQGEPYNAQELEDVDVYPEDSTLLVLLDSQTNAVSHKAFLSSHQWLFNVRLSSNQPSALCLRHDVDGLLWQPNTSDTENPWRHIATFNAFGYVQASKRDRKFSGCAPDFSYSVICDCIRHVYIYRQHSPTDTPLRNRKKGKNIKSIAKQQLISLEEVDSILGVHVTNEFLFLLTEKCIYVVTVNVTETI